MYRIVSYLYHIQHNIATYTTSTYIKSYFFSCSYFSTLHFPFGNYLVKQFNVFRIFHTGVCQVWRYSQASATSPGMRRE